MGRPRTIKRLFFDHAFFGVRQPFFDNFPGALAVEPGGLINLLLAKSRFKPTQSTKSRPKVGTKSAEGWSKIGPSLSPRSSKVGLSQRSAQASAQVQSWLTKVPVPSKNIKFGPKWVENRRFGLKLGPAACRDRSGAFGMGVTHSRGPSLG